MEEKIKEQLRMFDYFGIPTTQLTYSQAVDALIDLHAELLEIKVKADIKEFRNNLHSLN